MSIMDYQLITRSYIKSMQDREGLKQKNIAKKRVHVQRPSIFLKRSDAFDDNLWRVRSSGISARAEASASAS